MSLTLVRQELEEKQFREEIAKRREAQRRTLYQEYMEPVAEAFFERLKGRLAPMKVEDAITRRPSDLQKGVKILVHKAHGVVEDWFYFGIACNLERSYLHFVVESSYQSLHREQESYTLDLVWSEWDEEKFIALLDKAWAYVDANYHNPTKGSGHGWWSGFVVSKEEWP